MVGSWCPTTIFAVHEAVRIWDVTSFCWQVTKAAAEAQNYQRQLSMFRGGSRRGGERNVESGPDGWRFGRSAATQSRRLQDDLKIKIVSYSDLDSVIALISDNSDEIQ